MVLVEYETVNRKKLKDGSVRVYRVKKHYERKEVDARKVPRVKPTDDIIQRAKADYDAGVRPKLIQQRYNLTAYQVRTIAAGGW